MQYCLASECRDNSLAIRIMRQRRRMGFAGRDPKGGLVGLRRGADKILRVHPDLPTILRFGKRNPDNQAQPRLRSRL